MNRLGRMGPMRAAGNLAAFALRMLIRFYQIFVSPLLPAHCRYWPTCSNYAKTAIREHGAWSGTWLALRRIGRCHPWGGCGYDPVPPNPEKHASQHGKLEQHA
jgi:putative membrane protein insertion efficiency factor